MMFTRFFPRGRDKDKALERCLGEMLLSRDEFLERLRIERLRGERNNRPVGLITVDFTRMAKYISSKNGYSRGGVAGELAKTLKRNTRSTDIKGWFQKGFIALLAPDTDKEGADVLLEKLVGSLLGVYSHDGISLSREDMFRYFCVSSLKNDVRCLLTEDTDKSKAKAKRRGSGSRAKRLRFESVRPSFLSQYQLPTPGGAAAAVITWPLIFELLPQIRGREFQLVVKRLMDIFGALFGIVLFSPIMIVLAILVKITSPGPALFRQERLGHLGKRFTFLKFRSMHVNADSAIHQEYVEKLIKGETESINQGTDEKPVYKLDDDPRMTDVGRFIRKWSLDELPQFFNVIVGDMSLVGPRPPIPYECTAYQLWHYRRVLEAKPGITGLWQVNGRSSTTFDEMVRLDLQYSRNWSVRMDVKILFKTLWAVFSGRGAY